MVQGRGTIAKINPSQSTKSIALFIALGHATQKDRKTARSKKSILEPGTSQVPSIRQQESVME